MLVYTGVVLPMSFDTEVAVTSLERLFSVVVTLLGAASKERMSHGESIGELWMWMIWRGSEEIF